MLISKERKLFMPFWWFMFICNLLIPIIMVIAGLLMWIKCPKEINSFFGYRTTRSMINTDTWKFAHNYCGRLWFILGLITLIPTVIAQIPFYNSSEKVIGIVGTIIMTVQCAILIISIFPTEIALKRTFNDEGTRK